MSTVNRYAQQRRCTKFQLRLDLKTRISSSRYGDRAFCLGLTRNVLVSLRRKPNLTDKPGERMGAYRA